MIRRGKRPVLGVGVDVVDYDAAVAAVIDAARDRRPLAVTALAVHGVMTGVSDPAQRYRLNRFDLVTPDGQPVRWALSLLHGEALHDRVYGPTLMLRLCVAAAEQGIGIHLFGSRPEVLAALSANLTLQCPGLRITGTTPSRFGTLTEAEDAALDATLRDSGAGIVFVGLGCPRQEVFVHEHVQAVGLPMVAVGAAFDFHAGLLPQAPRWMQNRGLEWLFRLRCEPRRLWRRYLLLNPAYLVLLAAQRLGLLRRYLMRETVPPAPRRHG